MISDYEKKTSIEIGILTVESLNGETIADYAYQQFNRLGIVVLFLRLPFY